jgi:hypothetical protein
VNEFARGWTVLLAAFVGIGVNLASMVYYSAGIWVRPWQEEFGWTRAEIGAQQSLSVIVMMLLATFAGRLIDSYGLKIVTSISLLGYGVLLLGFTQMTGDLFSLYVLSAAYAVFGVASTALAFTRAVNAFFVKYRGLALVELGCAAHRRCATPQYSGNHSRARLFITHLGQLTNQKSQQEKNHANGQCENHPRRGNRRAKKPSDGRNDGGDGAGAGQKP